MPEELSENVCERLSIPIYEVRRPTRLGHTIPWAGVPKHNWKQEFITLGFLTGVQSGQLPRAPEVPRLPYTLRLGAKLNPLSLKLFVRIFFHSNRNVSNITCILKHFTSFPLTVSGFTICFSLNWYCGCHLLKLLTNVFPAPLFTNVTTYVMSGSSDATTEPHLMLCYYGSGIFYIWHISSVLFLLRTASDIWWSFVLPYKKFTHFL